MFRGIIIFILLILGPASSWSGSIYSAAVGKCTGSGTGARTTIYAAGVVQSCNQICATNISTSSCVEAASISVFGNRYFNYSNECSVANPQPRQAIVGKICCCHDSSRAQPATLGPVFSY